MTPLAPCDAECGGSLRAYWREQGIDVHVTTVQPIIPPTYEPLNMRCPHGLLWHCEPTSEQRATWARDGAP